MVRSAGGAIPRQSWYLCPSVFLPIRLLEPGARKGSPRHTRRFFAFLSQLVSSFLPQLETSCAAIVSDVVGTHEKQLPIRHCSPITEPCD